MTIDDNSDGFLPYVFIQRLRDNRGLTKFEKLVAFVLVSHASEGDNLVWPSNATIAAETGMSVDTVKDALRGLRGAGVQHPLGRTGKGGSMKRALFAPRHDAKSAGSRPQPKSKLVARGILRSGADTHHEVTTKVTTDDSRVVVDCDGPDHEVTYSVISGEVSDHGGVGSTDDCNPSGLHESPAPNCVEDLAICPSCGQNENIQGHAYGCRYTTCAACLNTDLWTSLKHDVGCPWDFKL